MSKRALTFLNESGDTTITWDEDSDDKMLGIIKKKMTEGVVFFIIEPRFGGLVAPKKTKLTTAQLEKGVKQRALAIRDEDLAKFVDSGAGELVKTPDTKVVTVAKAKTAEEVVAQESVAVRPLRGG